MYFLLCIVKTNSYHFRRCICRRKSCENGDTCANNSDCGRDEWNQKGECAHDITPYGKKHGRKHK